MVSTLNYFQTQTYIDFQTSHLIFLHSIIFCSHLTKKERERESACVCEREREGRKKVGGIREKEAQLLHLLSRLFLETAI